MMPRLSSPSPKVRGMETRSRPRGVDVVASMFSRSRATRRSTSCASS